MAEEAELRQLCIDTVQRFRAQAFDNVRIEDMIERNGIDDRFARWIGQHLLANSRNLEAYEAGQAILRVLDGSDAA